MNFLLINYKVNPLIVDKHHNLFYGNLTDENDNCD